MSTLVIEREIERPFVWLLWFRQHDNSGQEMLRVYYDGEEALRDAELVGNYALGEIRLERVSVHGRKAEQTPVGRPLPGRPSKPDDDEIPF